MPNQVLGCGAIPTGTKTQPTTWSFTWSNNTTTHNVILWPKGGAGQSPRPILFWDDPGNQNLTFNALQLSAQSWQNELSADATGNLLVSLQISANNTDFGNANIRAYDSTTAYLEQDQGGTVGGNETFLQYAPDWSTLVVAQVIVNANMDQTSTWTSALHEVGHALGLRHSNYQRSVMFPNGTPCVAWASFGFDYADMSWLEGTYDPRWMTPRPPSSPNPCKPPPCRMAAPVPSVQSLLMTSATSPVKLKHPYIVPRGGHTAPFPPYGTLLHLKPSSIVNHPRAHWIAADDNGNSATLSTDSLWLASSLVAQVRVLNPVGNVIKGPLETVYELARVERVFKEQYGPDSSVRAGDTILIADNQEANGDEFADDQALGPQDGSALVFLRDAGGQYNVGSRMMPIHGFTAQFASKYALRSDSSVAALSIRNTLIRQDYDGRSLTSMLQEVATGSSAMRRLSASYASKYTMDALTKSLLARNGITSPTQLADYSRTLSTQPFSYYRQRAKSDFLRNRSLIPMTRPINPIISINGN